MVIEIPTHLSRLDPLMGIAHRSMSISYQDKTIRQYLGTIAMVYKCPLVCLDHIYIGFCSRPDSSKDIFLLRKSLGSLFWRRKNWQKLFHFSLEICGFFFIGPSNLGARLPNYTQIVFSPPWSFSKKFVSSLIFLVSFLKSRKVTNETKKTFFATFNFERSS